ncbi:hypothetical protein C8R44DRAFT_867747 [Mycena epipterygia]|nr:hypothetical protein C8R44DRAFT_867747 [Mycena epipterygia]
MPSVRTDSTEKKLTDGEKFALVLGLEDRIQIFQQFKKVFRRLADDTFDFNLPVFQQQTAMNVFVEKVVDAFPGHFRESCENKKERITHLQRYARSYLEKSGKLAASNKKSPRKSQAAKTADAVAPPSPPPSPPKDKVIKVERPKPRPLYRGPKTNIFTVVDESMPAAPPIDTPAPNAAPAKGPVHRVKSKNTKTGIVVDEAMPVAPPTDTSRPKPVPAQRPAQHVKSKPLNARTSTVVDEPMPVAPPTNTSAPSPAPAPGSPHGKALDTTASTTKTKQIPAPDAAALPKFLGGCCPAMGHCAAAFERAGVVEQAHLVGMARWSDENVRRFLNANGIGRTALDVEAIIIGLAALSSEHVA